MIEGIILDCLAHFTIPFMWFSRYFTSHPYMGKYYELNFKRPLVLQHGMRGFCPFEDHLDQGKIKEGWISNRSGELFIRCKKSMRKLTC